jgi:hypothetical protein
MIPFFLLVADDHVDIGKLLQFTIRIVYQDRVRVKVIATVPELTDWLTSTEPLPDLLLLDYHLRPLPYKAPDVLTWIQSRDDLRTLAVKVWSSLPDGPEADACRQLGALSFTNKSDAMSDMIGFVKQLVEESAAEKADS